MFATVVAMGICLPVSRAGELLPGELPVEWGRELITPQEPPTVSDVIAAVREEAPKALAVIRLHADLNNHYAPHFSPDGQSLVFLRSDIEGSICKLVTFPRLSDERATVLYEDFLSYDHMPAWSRGTPTLLAFSSNNADDLQENIHLWTLSGEPVPLTSQRDSNVLPDLRRTESGTELLYRHEGELREVRFDPAQVVPSNGETLGQGTEASYSPDGAHIAIIRDGGGGHQLFLHDRQTARESPLSTPSGHYLRNPVWSPDGQGLACFSRPASEQSWSLRVLVPKSGEPSAVVVDGVRVQEDFRHLGPSWGPDSRKLWYVSTTGEGGYYPLRWTNADGAQSGRVDLPEYLLTASDVHCSPSLEQNAVAFVAVENRSLDVYVAILNHP
ncbi:MAG: PD40 domain-containing protein [Planctomycetaceae bacterium]|nr:PD40 domain-containing protein [Planctomycetaceae bacterium]